MPPLPRSPLSPSAPARPLPSAPRSDVDVEAEVRADADAVAAGAGSGVARAEAGASTDLKSLGERIILEAALEAGATSAMIDVTWKADRIVVTVDASKDENRGGGVADDGAGEAQAFELDEEDDDVLLDGEWDEEFEEGEFDEEGFLDDEEEFDPDDYDEVTPPSDGTIDLNLIARTINDHLARDGEDSPAYRIAKLHEIEVATPVFDGVLRGGVMFESYKGFDVTVEHWEDPKKKKQKKGKAQKAEGNIEVGAEKEEPAPEPKLKVTEGKLVGKDYEKDVTLINVRGRVVRIPNDRIVSVRLPEAKREKGVR